MIQFRDATEADLPAIVALLADDELGSGRDDPGPPLRDAYATGFRRMVAQDGRIILMLDGDAAIGCLQFNVIHGVSSGGMARAQVEGVRVARHRRGGGLGVRLMGEAIREARAAGCGMVQLTTNLSRTDAQRFYKGLGFIQSHAGMKLVL